MSDPQRAWLGVVSADHAQIAAAHGWIQLNHGKRNNLARLRRGDGFAFYSPTQRLGDKQPLRAVTQIGIVTDDEAYQADEAMQMGGSELIRPWRRTVDFRPSRPVPVRDLAGQLDLTREPNWGYSLRFGLLPLSLEDFHRLAEVMTQTPG
ncbi:EVE domain-containing protein [Kineosporia babensis]|uniref:EVE domain-containing protein n=1 Tax=Kineosporia babensis TaxID=499548 RepID=A0A9X1SXK7_9ACTN|nr:EVE domain-containing protein [Kineosporia babensis]